MGRGFLVCEWCGWGQPTAAGKPPKSHGRADHPGRECRGALSHVHLGHEYLTDVLEVRLTGDPVTTEAARSALYALLEAAPTVEVARDDINGTLNFHGAGSISFVLFDSVPGGAGHTQRLGHHLEQLVDAARDRVASCECGPETSCYACLRSYSNQIHHEELRRGDALRVLDNVLA